jgi:hypothetical protein
MGCVPTFPTSHEESLLKKLPEPLQRIPAEVICPDFCAAGGRNVQNPVDGIYCESVPLIPKEVTAILSGSTYQL